MTQIELTEQLLTLSDCQRQNALLAENRELIDQSLVDALKKKADYFLRADIHRSQQIADLILSASAVTNNKLYRAIGLLARGNALSIGAARYADGLIAYQEAKALYYEQHNEIGIARVEIGEMWSYFCLGDHRTAFDVGRHACTTLRMYNEWAPLMIATMNMACIYCQHGDDATSLDLLDQCLEICHKIDEGDTVAKLAWIQHNRAVSLRNLGRFEEAIQTSVNVQEILLKANQSVESARAQQNLAMTYFVLGRYNEALENLEQAYLVFQQDERVRDAMLVELFISDCLLHLRRFTEVLEKCQRVRSLFGELGVQQVVAQAIVNEATAYTHLARYSEALDSLDEARTVFEALENRSWVAMTQLERAAVLQRQSQTEASLQEAQKAAKTFAALGFGVEEAQANLLCGRAYLAMDESCKAADFASRALCIGQDKNLHSLTYLAYQLQAAIAEAAGDDSGALQHFDAAIQSVECLRGHMMIEHRADFLEDKQSIYEDAVRLCLKLGDADMGLYYAERSKSRALVDMLAYRLDMSLQAKSAKDQLLIDQLRNLQEQRDRLHRRLTTHEETKLRGWEPSDGENPRQQEIIRLEKEIASHWHTLLIRNADYASEAGLWQVRTEPIQPYLPDDAILLEYFVVQQQFVVFGVSSTEVFAKQLDCTVPQIQQLLRFLQLNLNRVPHSSSQQIEQSVDNARGLLQELYTHLLEPLMDRIANVRHLILVPHSILHYLPFHALFTGDSYLLEKHLISYLPAASLLRYCRQRQSTAVGAFIYGNSLDGELPNTLNEVDAIATEFDTQAYKEYELSQDTLYECMIDARLIHFATHGEFRSDNPLFSGILIGKRWLTMLDIFNLRLQASLVTLSGCQTGRNAIKGGDELVGLMRAFLATGASSLLLSLWNVEDRSSSHLMQTFYQHLAQGVDKGLSLRQAQLQLLHGQDASWSHPYFWSAFFLVGDWGVL